MIAALFVLKDGPYSRYPGIVDPWPEERDARLYPGPFPVVAHPPCERWGRYARGGPSAHGRFKIGDDAGCFAAALMLARAFGGVIEHPQASLAWRKFGLAPPIFQGGWHPADDIGGFGCCVEQGHYGHEARKATWLYVCGVDPDKLPDLKWGSSGQRVRLDAGFHSREERARAVKTGRCQRLSSRQRKITPRPFAELLISIASTARGIA